MSYLQRVHEAAEAETLSRDELSYYSRHLLLPGLGARGQKSLKAARVLVVGAGGLGCPVLNALTGAGVGHLSIIDGDQIEASNIARQWLHPYEAIGANKAISAREHLKQINPFIELTAHPEMFTSANAAGLAAKHDLIVDATDNLKSRELIDQVCADIDIPWVHAALYRNTGQLTVFWARHEVRYADLFTTSAQATSCSEAGVLGAVASIVGNLQAMEVIKLISGLGEPLLGTLLSVDANTLKLERFRFSGKPVLKPIQIPVSSEAGENSLTLESMHQMESIGTPIRLIDLRMDPKDALKSAFKTEARTPDEILTEGFDPSELGVDVFVCETGAMSGLLADALRSRGPTNIYHLSGGANVLKGAI